MRYSRSSFFFLLILVTTASSAWAADLQVSALEVFSNGTAQPIGGARVCVGTESNPTMIGTRTTDISTGSVTFNNLRPGEYLVTVSADGFLGQQRRVTITGNVSAAAFRMERCAGNDCGPSCGLAPGTIRNPPRGSDPLPPGKLEAVRLRITSFYINNRTLNLATSRDVRLYFTYSSMVAGLAPTHYRASESENFEGAAWLELPRQQYTGDPFVNYTLSGGPGRQRTVYFQLRAGAGETAQTSNVARDTIDLEAQIYVISETAQVFTYARDQDFSHEALRKDAGGGRCRVFFEDTNLDASLYAEGASVDPTGSIRLAYSSATCSFELFRGRMLNPGWKLKSITLSLNPNECNPPAPGWAWTKGPSGTEDPHVSLILINKGGLGVGCRSTTLYISEVVLEGPPGADWRDAFRRN